MICEEKKIKKKKIKNLTKEQCYRGEEKQGEKNEKRRETDKEKNLLEEKRSQGVTERV